MRVRIEKTPISNIMHTAAELSFRLKQREKALEWCQKALDLDKTEELYRKDLKRFKEGPFPETSRYKD